MKSNELRIGNWIDCGTYVNKGHWSKFERIKITSGSQLNVTDNLKPIPLTPEILEKAKFSGTIFPAQLSIGETGKIYWGNGVNIEIKYLHQLQNLYFELTGEELAIEL